MPNRKCRMDDTVENPRWREDDEPSHLMVRELVDRGMCKLHVADLWNRLTLEYCLITNTDYDEDGRVRGYRYIPILKDDYYKLKRQGLEEV